MQVKFFRLGFFQITVTLYAASAGKKWMENTGSKKKLKMSHWILNLNFGKVVVKQTRSSKGILLYYIAQRNFF